MRKDLLKQVDAKIYSYPNISHEQVVRRELLRKKPFNETGKGYRDYLIWRTVLEIAKESDEPIALITKNTKDFADNDNNLHSDLISDLNKESVSSNNIILFTDVSQFNDKYIIPTLEVLENVCQNLKHQNYDDINLEELVRDYILKTIYNMNFDTENISIGPLFESPSLSEVEEVDIIDINDVYRLSSGELLVNIQAEADCIIDVYIFKSDYYILNEDESSDIAVWDRDWNKHYIWATIERKLNLEMDLTFDEQNKEITSMEINSVHV